MKAEYQVILQKEDNVIYANEDADIKYYVDVLGFKEIGNRTIEDNLPTNIHIYNVNLSLSTDELKMIKQALDYRGDYYDSHKKEIKADLYYDLADKIGTIRMEAINEHRVLQK